MFIVLAGLATFAFLTAFVLIPHRSLDRPDDAMLKHEGKQFVADMVRKADLSTRAPGENSETADHTRTATV